MESILDKFREGMMGYFIACLDIFSWGISIIIHLYSLFIFCKTWKIYNFDKASKILHFWV